MTRSVGNDLKGITQTWEDMLLSNTTSLMTPDKIRKMKKLVRKHGIPEHLRAKSWVAVTGARDKLLENAGMYKRLCEEMEKVASESIHVIQIDKDVERTTIEGIITDKMALRRVLGAYSVLNATIGYCQSMNFIVSALLTVVSEEEAFWMLVSIVEYILPDDYYSATMVGVQSDIMVFKNMISRRFPRVTHHLSVLQALYRVLDLFMVEGHKALFRVGLALFKMNEKILLLTNDFEQILDLILKMPSNADIQALLEHIVSLEVVTTIKLSNMRKTTLTSLKPEENCPPSPASPPLSPTRSPNPPVRPPRNNNSSTSPRLRGTFSFSTPQIPFIAPTLPPILSRSHIPSFTSVSSSPTPSPVIPHGPASPPRAPFSHDPTSVPLSHLSLDASPISPRKVTTSHRSPAITSRVHPPTNEVNLTRSPPTSPTLFPTRSPTLKLSPSPSLKSTPSKSSSISSAPRSTPSASIHVPLSPTSNPSVPLSLSPPPIALLPSSPQSAKASVRRIGASNPIATPSSPSLTRKDDHFATVLAGMPSSPPLQPPPLFRQDSLTSSYPSSVTSSPSSVTSSSSRSPNPPVPSRTRPGPPSLLSRSPSSPVFSQYLHPSTSTPSSSSATPPVPPRRPVREFSASADVSHDDVLRDDVSYELQRAKSEEEVLALKRNNRRAKMDNFNAIPVLRQVAHEHEAPAQRNAALALASFSAQEGAARAGVDAKEVPWYLQQRVRTTSGV